jgi:hypothetical protein
MKAAAEMRVAGMTWSRVEEKLGCRPGTCRNWPSRYPAEWKTAYAAALAERDEDSEAESIRTLRELLRDKDQKTQREAARDLLAALLRRDKSTRSAKLSNDPVENLSNEELAALILALDPAAKEVDRMRAEAADDRSE